MPTSPLPSPDPSVTAEHSALVPSRPLLKPPLYYRLVIAVLKPLYRVMVWRRSHERENYRQEVAQRFGKAYPPRPVSDSSEPAGHIIWCHAVSLGETNTVAPLLDSLMHKGYQIWLTNTTQTGFARGASRFADDITQGRLSHSYVPVDTPAVIETFLAHVQPVAALFVETELWANILSKLSQQHIPSILVNGRLSAASFRRYQKIHAVTASMMQNLTLIIAQDDESAKRFRQLGADSGQIRVAGSLKWVINTPKTNQNLSHINTVSEPCIEASVDEACLNNRCIWVAASTHAGEEALALSMHQRILSDRALAHSLLIIVPRHPERFDEVATLIESSGLKMARRSAKESIDDDTQVYLADSMGELMQWYQLADVALVGGSLVDIGGHNPVEPASVATPILMGPYTQSCQTVVDKLAEVGALYQPHNDHYQAIQQASATAIDDSLSRDYNDLDQSPLSEDVAFIYQQLKFWLSHQSSAKQAGQAAKNLTEQQQSVLTQQQTMIEEMIVASSIRVSEETLEPHVVTLNSDSNSAAL